MQHEREGTGKLVPTGYSGPAVTVSFVISFSTKEIANPSGKPVRQNLTKIHSITPLKGAQVPPGDYDLIVGKDLLRVRRNLGNPEWIVLSNIE